MSASISLRPMMRLAGRQLLHSAPRRSVPVLGHALRRCYSQQQANPANQVRLVEVGPRDGLQNEKKSIPVATKLELIRRLALTGLPCIEAGSFVSPKWVPQMEGSGEIMESLLTQPPESPIPMTYSFLAPNAKGFENAAAIMERNPKTFWTQSDALVGSPPIKPALELAVFAAATETFSQKNLNCDIATSLTRFRDVIQGAKKEGIRARAYISVALGCPFEGYEVDPHKVAEIAAELLAMGADEIAIGDTTGMGTAPRTQDLLRCLTAAGIRNEDLAMHFHDTYGQALVNTAVALESGIRTFDSSIAGLGGCPYSPGATGNVSTENMVYFLETLGLQTGIDLDALTAIGDWISKEIGKPNDSAVGRALLASTRK